MPWGNCWTYALPRWLKNPGRTYLVVRLTRNTWLPVLHVFFARSIEHLEVEEFKPSDKTLRWTSGRLGYLLRPLITPFFHGRIRKGKGEE